MVEAVLRGEDVVVHAASGTGTTQTIANVVAALAGQRNSVLLVAEQRSEIDDVRRRLESVGLGSLVADVGDGLFDHRGTMAQVVGPRRGVRVGRVVGRPAAGRGQPARGPAASPSGRAARPRGGTPRGPGPVGRQRARRAVRDQ